MGKRYLVVAILVAAALIVFAPKSDAGVNVLLLPDGPQNDPGDGINSFFAALLAEGHTVTMGPIEYTWNGSNPSLDEFDVVVHFNGKTWKRALPVAGQQALVNFVRLGGGYVGGQWNGYEAFHGLLVDMDDLVLQLSGPPPDNCINCSMNWTTVSGMGDHPMLAGIPESFEFFAGAHDAGPLVDFAVDPSTVLMTAPGGGPAVTVREFGYGRVVAFSAAPNQKSELTLQETYIQLLYLNAVAMVTELPQVSPFVKLLNEIKNLEASGAINRGQANALTNKVEAALRQIERNNIKAAQKHMWLFVKQVETWIRAGILTEAEGAPLLEIAHQIIAGLGG
jgi:hypothetical protein